MISKLVKKVKQLLFLAFIGCLCCGAYKLLCNERVQEKLFSILGEDLYLALLEKARLLGDLMKWPVEYVRALLP